MPPEADEMGYKQLVVSDSHKRNRSFAFCTSINHSDFVFLNMNYLMLFNLLLRILLLWAC